VARVVMDPSAYVHMDHICSQLAHHVGGEVFNDVERGAPVLTGQMKATIRKVDLPKASQVWVGSDHWHFVEYGTAPHIIRSHGPWLLQDKSRGKVFGRVVHHPGATENPFMRRAIFQKRRLPYVGGM
jgi:hypothetical protein